MLAYLRARAMSSGFLGGSRMWIGIGFVVWTVRFFQWLTRAETEVIYREPLGAGQSVTIHHGEPPLTRRERKKAAQRAKKDAKVTKRQDRRDAELAEKEAVRAEKQARRAARAARRAGEQAAAS